LKSRKNEFISASKPLRAFGSSTPETSELSAFRIALDATPVDAD